MALLLAGGALVSFFVKSKIVNTPNRPKIKKINDFKPEAEAARAFCRLIKERKNAKN